MGFRVFSELSDGRFVAHVRDGMILHVVDRGKCYVNTISRKRFAGIQAEVDRRKSDAPAQMPALHDFAVDAVQPAGIIRVFVDAPFVDHLPDERTGHRIAVDPDLGNDRHAVTQFPAQFLQPVRVPFRFVAEVVIKAAHGMFRMKTVDQDILHERSGALRADRIVEYGCEQVLDAQFFQLFRLFFERHDVLDDDFARDLVHGVIGEREYGGLQAFLVRCRDAFADQHLVAFVHAVEVAEGNGRSRHVMDLL